MPRYRIRARRKRLGWTQGQLAERAGVHSTYPSMLELDKTTPPGAVRSIRCALLSAEMELRERRRDERRVERQRALWDQMPECWATARFKQALLDRAWQLLDDNKSDEVDAILEFVPEDDARKLLDEFFEE